MKKNFLSPSHRRSERGQSTIMVALSLAALLLLLIGAAVLLFAVFTASTMEDYDGDSGVFESFESQDYNDPGVNIDGPGPSSMELFPLECSMSFVVPNGTNM